MKTFLLAFLVFAFLNVDAQRAGTLDSSFGTNGIIISGNNNGENRLLASAILNDDKIFTASTYEQQPYNVTLFSRYNADGTPDLHLAKRESYLKIPFISLPAWPFRKMTKYL